MIRTLTARTAALCMAWALLAVLLVAIPQSAALAEEDNTLQATPVQADATQPAAEAAPADDTTTPEAAPAENPAQTAPDTQSDTGASSPGAQNDISASSPDAAETEEDPSAAPNEHFESAPSTQGEAGESSADAANAIDAGTHPTPTETDEAIEQVDGAQGAQAPQGSQDAQTPQDSQLNATSNTTQTTSDYKPILQAVTGTTPLLVIVAGFKGDGHDDRVDYSHDYDWASSIFTGEGNVCSYYSDMSNGAFTFVPAAETSAFGRLDNLNQADRPNDGIVHITTDRSHGNWRNNWRTNPNPSEVYWSMRSTFRRILSTARYFVDFSSFDADGDGWLSARELTIAFIVAGYETSFNPDLTKDVPSIWAHRSKLESLGGATLLDHVWVNEYVAMGENILLPSDEGTWTEQTPTSVLMHELGHTLGLRDLYPTGTSGDWWPYTVDDLSLMASGNWTTVTDASGKTVYAPTSIDAWGRYQLGWTTPIVVAQDGVYTIHSQNSTHGYSTLLIPTKNEGEYYLLENRSFIGHDAALAEQYGSLDKGGLVLWHIDNNVVRSYLPSNKVNSTTHRPGVIPLLAENIAWGYQSPETRQSAPDFELALFSKAICKTLFPALSAVPLPLYSGLGFDEPGNRSLSDIWIEFLTDAGPEMDIRLWFSSFPFPREDPAEDEPADEPTGEPEDQHGDEPTNKPAGHHGSEAAAGAPAHEPKTPALPKPAPLHHAAAEPVNAPAMVETRTIPATGDTLPLAPLAAMALAALVANTARKRRLEQAAN